MHIAHLLCCCCFSLFNEKSTSKRIDFVGQQFSFEISGNSSFFFKAFALLKVKNGRYANCTVRTIGIIINLVFQFELTLTFNTCDQWAHFIYMEFSMKISQSVFKLSREKNIFFLDYHRHRHQLRIESTVPMRHNAIYVSVYMLVDIYESKNRL